MSLKNFLFGWSVGRLVAIFGIFKTAFKNFPFYIQGARGILSKK